MSLRISAKVKFFSIEGGCGSAISAPFGVVLMEIFSLSFAPPHFLVSSFAYLMRCGVNTSIIDNNDLFISNIKIQFSANTEDLCEKIW